MQDAQTTGAALVEGINISTPTLFFSLLSLHEFSFLPPLLQIKASARWEVLYLHSQKPRRPKLRKAPNSGNERRKKQKPRAERH